MDFLYDAAEAIVEFMDSAPSLPLTLLYIFIAGIPVTLLHELGHALAVTKRLGERAEVSVGSVGKLAEVWLGQLTARINAVALPGQAAGEATFDDSRATAQDIAWIAAAGPLASLVGTVAVGAMLAVGPDDGVVRDLLRAGFLVGIFGVLNIVPFEFQERRSARRMRSDGRLALDALRVARALR